MSRSPSAALVKAAYWMTHIKHDWASPIWRPWFERLCESFRFVRYDTRGYQREVPRLLPLARPVEAGRLETTHL